MKDMATELIRRQQLGQIIREEFTSRGWNIKGDAETRTGVVRSVLYRIFDGEPDVTPVIYARVRAGLDLPPDLFSYFLAGDTAGIQTLPLDPKYPGWDDRMRGIMLRWLQTDTAPLKKTRARQTSA